MPEGAEPDQSRRTFGGVLIWTAIGALIPGSALLAAGFRRTGAVIIAGLMLVLVPAMILVATGEAKGLALFTMVRPRALLAIAVGAVLAGVLWAAIVVLGHLALRGHRTAVQRWVGGVLVFALVTAVLVPAGTLARYALAQRALLLNVFGQNADGGSRESGLAAPDVSASEPWTSAPRINVLLIGSDAGPGRSGTRADTIITASVNTQTGETVLFSLPRNLEYAPFPAGSPGARSFPNGFYCPGHRECLLNGIWTWAENNDELFPHDSIPGLTATRQAVGETLGLRIDYYVKMDLAGFKELVDAMGGLEVEVPRRVPIPGGTLEPGRQILLGEEVLAYSRSRSDSDDYERMERQRCLVGEIIRQADPPRMALAFPAIAASAQRTVSTDIRLAELDAFVQLAMKVQRSTIRSIAFTDALIRSSNPDFEYIRASVHEALNDESAKAANGASREGEGLNATQLTPDGATKSTSTSAVSQAEPEDLRETCSTGAPLNRDGNGG